MFDLSRMADPHYHNVDFCMQRFEHLADVISVMVTAGYKYNAIIQLQNCWQRRAEMGKNFSIYSPGYAGHMDAVKLIMNLWSWLKDNDIGGSALQLQYREPKTFDIFVGGFGYLGSITPQGYIDPHLHQLHPLMGGIRGKRKATRRAGGKARKTRHKRK
jgi:hypothetical protein